jgi:hypothetical protein
VPACRVILSATGRIARVETPVDGHVIPALGVTGVSDGDVVVLTPEERDGVEALASAEEVPRRRLPLTLRDYPVLDSAALTCQSIRIARYVPRREDARHARLEALVYQDSLVRGQGCALGELEVGSYTDAGHYEVGADLIVVRGRNPPI